MGGCNGLNIDINDGLELLNADDQLAGNVIQALDGVEAADSNDETKALAAACEFVPGAVVNCCCCWDWAEVDTADWAKACNKAWYGNKLAELLVEAGPDLIEAEPDGTTFDEGLMTGNEDKNDDRSLV